MDNVEKKIRAVRPRLAAIAPLTASIVFLFSMLNLSFGTAMIFDAAAPARLFIINSFITQQVWGSIFLLVGIAMIYYYMRNDWKRTRQLLAVGVFIKVFWLLALIVRALEGTSSNALLLILWLFITGVQMYTFIYFIPGKRTRYAE